MVINPDKYVGFFNLINFSFIELLTLNHAINNSIPKNTGPKNCVNWFINSGIGLWVPTKLSIHIKYDTITGIGNIINFFANDGFNSVIGASMNNDTVELMNKASHWSVVNIPKNVSINPNMNKLHIDSGYLLAISTISNSTL